MNDECDSRHGLFAVILLLIIVVACVIGWYWYAAGVQQAVYARQGCHMSKWEIFMGAKPIVRNLNSEQ